MRKYRLRIGLDVDDTLYECNSYALELLRQRYGDNPAFEIDHIDAWGKLGDIADERLAYFGDPEFVRNQPIYPGAQKFVKDLCKFADVFFITAVPPSCMSARAERLRADFPEVPDTNILIGTRKDIVNLDILLDDAAHNISTSQASYPVLMRRPWNSDLSGLLSVNSYADFVHLAKSIGNSFVGKPPDLTHGGVLCIVGPTGTGKTAIAEALTHDPRFFKPLTTTTRPRLQSETENAYRFVSKEDFLQAKKEDRFVETTVYGKHYFGTSLSEFEPIKEGKIAVLPIDVCGALTLRNLYRSKAMLVYTDRDKKRILANILRRAVTDEDKIHRLMSLDFEMRNKELCDFAVCIDDGLDHVVATIIDKLGLEN
jgi:guanylate kinase